MGNETIAMDDDKEQSGGAGYARSIDLPQLFRNMKNAKGFIAADIGENAGFAP